MPPCAIGVHHRVHPVAVRLATANAGCGNSVTSGQINVRAVRDVGTTRSVGSFGIPVPGRIQMVHMARSAGHGRSRLNGVGDFTQRRSLERVPTALERPFLYKWCPMWVSLS